MMKQTCRKLNNQKILTGKKKENKKKKKNEINTYFGNVAEDLSHFVCRVEGDCVVKKRHERKNSVSQSYLYLSCGGTVFEYSFSTDSTTEYQFILNSLINSVSQLYLYLSCGGTIDFDFLYLIIYIVSLFFFFLKMNRPKN